MVCFASDLDARTLSEASLKLMMLLGGFRSLWSISISFLSIFEILSSVCSSVYTM